MFSLDPLFPPENIRLQAGFSAGEWAYWKRQRGALVLAHYYQSDAVKALADFVGDSLELAKKARESSAQTIVMAGVRFMAETAKILCPDKTILLPDSSAGCSLVDDCPPDEFAQWVEAHPGHIVLTYINSSVEVKAQSDWICTSSNALSILRQLPVDQPILFAPDRHLGAYLMRESGREMVLWNGRCVVHEAFSFDRFLELRMQHPEAVLIAHPESEAWLLNLADFVGSTSAMIRYAERSAAVQFLVGTEVGILSELRSKRPDAVFVPLDTPEPTDCGCSECAFMKLHTPVKMVRSLRFDGLGIQIDPEVMDRARKPLLKMLQHG